MIAMPGAVICWRWTPPAGYRSRFGPETVNILRAMVGRQYDAPHRFICFTDEPAGLDQRIETYPIGAEFSSLPNPNGSKHPSCYRRLRSFSPEFADLVGPRFVSLDLDCVITANVTKLWRRPEDFVIWGDTNPNTHYNASMYLLTTGARRQVWDTFEPTRSPALAFRAKQFGSDQAWIGYCLGGGEARFSMLDGVYSYRNEIKPMGGRLPLDARMVMFHGRVDPESPEAQALPWVRAHYALEVGIT